MCEYNETLLEFGDLIREKTFNPFEGELKVGVDLGTANIVLAVVDSENRPVAGATYPSTVVRDGIVVDFIGASKAVREMKAELEDMLGVELRYAATAIPPGIMEGNVKVIANVVEASNFEVSTVIDEPTAAATVLGVTEGAVVDVGGGTTGISILKDGKVVFVADDQKYQQHYQYERHKKGIRQHFCQIRMIFMPQNLGYGNENAKDAQENAQSRQYSQKCHQTDLIPESKMVEESVQDGFDIAGIQQSDHIYALVRKNKSLLIMISTSHSSFFVP